MSHGCDLGSFVVLVLGLFWLGWSQRLYFMCEFNLVSYINVCCLVLLADGILAGRFLWQVSLFCLKQVLILACLSVRVAELLFEPSVF